MHRLSFSRMSIARWCVWWAMPGLALPYDPPGPPARFGSAFHAGAGEHVNGTVPDPVALAARFELDGDAADRLAVMLDGWRERNPTITTEHGWASEVAFALDAAASEARVLGRDIGRRYKQAGLREHEIPGAADLLKVEADYITVRDLKTGSAENVDDVADNGQLVGLGLASALAYGVRQVRVELEFVDASGQSAIYAHTLDDFDLDAAAAEFADIWQRVQAPEPKPVAGDHCRWCPARTICPEHHAPVTEIVHVDDRRRLPVVVDRRGFQDAAHAAWQVEALRRAKVVLEAAEAAVRGYADDHGGIDMGNGRVWAAKEQSREYVNRRTIRVAAEMLAAADGRSIDEAERDILQAAREAGGITVSRFHKYEARRP